MQSDKLDQCGQDPCSQQSRLITPAKMIVGEFSKVPVLPNPRQNIIHAFN
jgi:hypothetical protein